MMEQVLLEQGVDPSQISVIPSEVEALDHGLKMARPHDLLLVFGDDCPRCWKQITGFGEEAQATTADVSNDAHDFSMPNPMLEVNIEFPEGDLIQDDRGVRLARIEEGD